MLPDPFSRPQFREYISNSSAYQQLLGEDGKPDPHWENFFQSYFKFGEEEIVSRKNDILRLLRENGVTYNIHGDPSGLNRPWKLDIIPFLINRTEWHRIESGLKQRAELMNLILEDIYGEKQLIRQGILPMELVYNHSGFLRECSGIKPPGPRRLVLYSADLARSSSGELWVVNDRTQAPSGSGYALENRTTIARVIPELFEGLKVRHLSPYFNALRDGLNAIAPAGVKNPRIVILTPGASNETYFEHSFLSSYLGFTLAQGNDLVVKDNFVWLKTLGGLEKVDVILRRVDDVYCDPVELREDSQLGIPGLLQAVRKGNVGIANPLGSGILENPGLMPFMQKIADFYFGEELILPTIASWWCGQEKELQYVLDNLSSLVVKRIQRSSAGSSAIDGASLTHDQLSDVKAQILADPTLFVGQEKVEISYTPSLINGKIEPRKALFRNFLVGTGEGYTSMAGGLCRTSTEAGNFLISNQLGGFSKDAWVIAPEPGRIVHTLKETAENGTAGFNNMLPSHAAENLFWVGRYTERLLGNARFLRTVMQFLAEGNKLKTFNNEQTEKNLLTAFTNYSYSFPGFTGDQKEEKFADPWKELRDILFNEKRIGGIRNNFIFFHRAIQEVRDHWSTDTWRVIRIVEEELQPNQSNASHLQMLHTLDDLITSMVAFIGLNRESISREQGWIMLDLGRKIEQSLLLINMLKAAMGGVHSEQVEYNLMQAVLMSNENLVNYRYKYRLPVQNSLVLDLMLFDPNNPRSLTYQMDRLKGHVKNLPNNSHGYAPSAYESQILEADILLRQANRKELIQPDKETRTYRHLNELLGKLHELLASIPGMISKTYFKHEMTSQPMVMLR